MALSGVPLVSIGLPVFNGMPHLRVAVDSLLKQTHSHVEVVICDNASDDGTSEYCRALAEVHPQVRYTRNASNLGPLENFGLVLSQARGRYFMWAAHDDKWNSQFVSGLVERMADNSDAVLATPAVIHIREDGTLCSEPPDRPATGESAQANLRLLYEDHAASWIYGLWQTAWLKDHFREYRSLPYWGADVLWLADICQRHPVVGNQDSVIYKRLRPSGYAPRSSRATIIFWASMFWHLSRSSIRRNETRAARLRALLMSWAYVYRLGIRRPYPLRTVWRVVRMISLAAITSLPVGLLYAWRRLTRKRLSHST
jgi:glycosyltransferase involved in cell wall biosynthesis